jgi:hypothetical protein
MLSGAETWPSAAGQSFKTAPSLVGTKRSGAPLSSRIAALSALGQVNFTVCRDGGADGIHPFAPWTTGGLIGTSTDAIKSVSYVLG